MCLWVLGVCTVNLVVVHVCVDGLVVDIAKWFSSLFVLFLLVMLVVLFGIIRRCRREVQFQRFSNTLADFLLLTTCRTSQLSLEF